MNFTPQQGAAIQRITAWARQRGGPQVMRMFGYAGTGKTTLAKEVAAAMPGTVFAAYTGKASLVLTLKGCPASTIHRMIYKVRTDEVTGQATYTLNPDSPAATAPLICVDEVSMVDALIGRDLLSHGTKVLVLGAPAQLPPVKGTGFFITGEPDIMLTEVHRQAQDNPIIQMSMTVRTGGHLALGEYGTSRVIRRRDIDRDAMRDIAMAADQILVGRNATRTALNKRVRQIKGNETWQPVNGDKLICLRNNHMKGLLNGGLWEASQVSVSGDTVNMRVTSLDDGSMAPLDVETPGLYFEDRQQELHWKDRKEADEFTYGYAITVHKSQGSQFNNVLLMDESQAFREDAARHLYTGLTRAADRVTVVID